MNLVNKPKFASMHGDFRRRNIIIQDDLNLKVVDWEYFNNGPIYWDLAVFIGDMMHQRYHNVQHIDPMKFIKYYRKSIDISKDEVELVKILGAAIITNDHINPWTDKKPPEPRVMFKNFNTLELNYLLDE